MLALLESVRYTVKDAQSKKDPADYVASIVLNGKNAGIATNDAAQVLLAYEHIDRELRRDLPRPKSSLTIANLLEELCHHKDIWFDIYGTSHGSAVAPSRQDNRHGKPQGQYFSNPVCQNLNLFQRPYGGNYGNGFSSYGGPLRPYFGSLSPYGRPPFPTYGGYQNNNNNINSQTQAPQPSRPLGPGS